MGNCMGSLRNTSIPEATRTTAVSAPVAPALLVNHGGAQQGPLIVQVSNDVAQRSEVAKQNPNRGSKFNGDVNSEERLDAATKKSRERAGRKLAQFLTSRFKERNDPNSEFTKSLVPLNVKVHFLGEDFDEKYKEVIKIILITS